MMSHDDAADDDDDDGACISEHQESRKNSLLIASATSHSSIFPANVGSIRSLDPPRSCGRARKKMRTHPNCFKKQLVDLILF